MNRKMMMICGRNTMTLPTPEITPFCRKLCSRPAGRASCTIWPRAANATDNSSINGCAQLNTAGTSRIESGEDDKASDGMQHHRIDAGRQRVRLGRHDHGFADDAV